MEDENYSDADARREGEELMAALRSDLGVKTDKEVWEVAVQDVPVHESWTRHLLRVLNLTFMDAGGLGIGVTQFADTRDPGTIFFARSLFVTRFEREGLGDLARWWMNHPSRRRGSSARVEGHGRIVFTDGPSAAT